MKPETISLVLTEIACRGSRFVPGSVTLPDGVLKPRGDEIMGSVMQRSVEFTPGETYRVLSVLRKRDAFQLGLTKPVKRLVRSHSCRFV